MSTDMSTDMKNQLSNLAEAAAPRSAIDIARARHDGRRRMLTGRLAAAGGGVAVVAACGLAVGGLAGGGSTSAQAAAGGTPAPAGTASGSGAPAAKTPAEFTGTDPLSTHAMFGKLPDGWKLGTVEDGPDDGNHLEAYSGTDKVNGPYANLQISDKERSAETFNPKATTEKAIVAGSPKAVYITIPVTTGIPAPDYGLQWQTSKGTWATLFVSRIGSEAASRALLNSLAAGITVGDKPVPLPIHIDGLPETLAVSGTELNKPSLRSDGKSGWDVQQLFDQDGKMQVVVTAWPVGMPATQVATPHPGTSTRTLDPSIHVKAPVCKDSNALHICVEDHSGAADVLKSVGGAEGLLDHITSLGTDPEKWTTHVVS